MRSVAAFVVVLALSACSDDGVGDYAAYAKDAELERRLTFTTLPTFRRLTEDEFAAETRGRASESTDAEVANLTGIFGRLGYFSKSEDVRAARTDVTVGNVAAYYETEQKAVTLIGDPTAETIVHELVHALQDEHFDLQAIDEGATTTDAVFARRALVEGDATVAELRFEARQASRRPEEALPALLLVRIAPLYDEEVFERSTRPELFSAYPAFAYGYGARYVARRLGLRADSTDSWDYAALDRTWRQELPETTEEVLRGRRDDDPVEEVGLQGLPRSVRQTHGITEVDRLGEWMLDLLTRRAKRGIGSTPVRFDVESWDGDQLVVLRKRSAAGAPEGPPDAVVLTTIWDDERSAQAFQILLANLQGLPADRFAPPSVLVGNAAEDGELVHLERDGRRVVLVKNLLREQAADTAAYALGRAGNVAIEDLVRRPTVPRQRIR